MSRARKTSSTHLHDYINPYVADLGNSVDMALVASSRCQHRDRSAWRPPPFILQPIIERYGLKQPSVNDASDPTFRFMTADWDGKIRMDCFLALRDGEPDPDARKIRRRLCQRHDATATHRHRSAA